MPTSLATVKWPSSCSTISSTIPRIVRAQLMHAIFAGDRAGSGGWPGAPRHAAIVAKHSSTACEQLAERGHEPARELARPSVRFVQRLERAHRLDAQLG